MTEFDWPAWARPGWGGTPVPETRDPGVLDLGRPYRCLCGKPPAAVGDCADCNANDPPGAFALVQDGLVFGWSESNIRYEVIGQLPDSQQMEVS